MHSVEVDTTVDGEIVIAQRWNDINERDPEITISAEQAPLLASWLLEAAEEELGEAADSSKIPIKYWANGPEGESEQMEVYTNKAGLIVLRITDDAFIELSPSMAKRLREQLSKEITSSIANLFRPDSEA